MKSGKFVKEPSNFIHELRSCIQDGYGVCPFLGSGVSANSGVIMGQDFDNYLAYVVWMVVGDEKWNLQVDGWPTFPDSKKLDEALTFISQRYDSVLKSHYCFALRDKDDGGNGRKLISRIISSTYDVKVRSSLGAEKPPEEAQRLLLFWREKNRNRIFKRVRKVSQRSRFFWRERNSIEEAPIRVYIFGNEEDEAQSVLLDGKESEELVLFLRNLWNQNLPTRSKRDLLLKWNHYVESVLDEDKETEQNKPLKDYRIQESEFPESASQRLTRQLRRPLVPAVLRGGLSWEEEEELEKMREAHDFVEQAEDPNLSKTSEEYVIEQALRALSHWTTTLEFLARTRVGYRHNTHPSSSGKAVFLEEKDASIIDSFNLFITRGKNPNMIHNMVARLTRTLRVRTILTTNFDTLCEKAFRAQRELLHPMAVSIKGSLPAFATVRAQNSLVKLHGDISETRADPSINEPPSEEDKRRFHSYLHGPARPFDPPAEGFTPNCLLVLGYSGNDARCIQMIKYALDYNNSGLKVFWVAHTRRDVEEAERRFSSYIKDGHFVLTQTRRPDLLLWELYQRINLTLPGGGYNFEFTHLTPPRSLVKTNEKEDAAIQLKKTEEKIWEMIKEKNIAQIVDKTGEDEKGWTLSIDHGSGLAGPLVNIYRRLDEERKKPLWFELEDYADPISLLREVIQGITLDAGKFEQGVYALSVVDFKDAGGKTAGSLLWKGLESQLRRFKERTRIVPSDYYLFFYGRNGPGGCRGMQMSYWNEAHYKQLQEVLKLLESLGFRCIYLPFGEERAARNKGKIKLVTKRAGNSLKDHDEQLGYQLWKAIGWGDRHQESTPLSVPKDSVLQQDKLGEEFEQARNFKPMLKSVLKTFALKKKDVSEGRLRSRKTRAKASRMLWLYGWTLFRQSRHSSALLCDAVFPCPRRFQEGIDNDLLRDFVLFGIEGEQERVEEWAEKTVKAYENIVHPDEDFNLPERKGWMNWLGEKSVIYQKEGGYAWKYRDTRLAIQYLLENNPYFCYFQSGLPQEQEEENATDGEPISSQSEPRRFQSIWQIRGRIHYWIADWYLRAYHSTLHSQPLLESAYHAYHALCHASYYQPSFVVDGGLSGDEEETLLKRQKLAWRAICLLRRLAHAGQTSLLYWLPGNDLWEEHINETSSSTGNIDAWIDNLKNHLCVNSKGFGVLTDLKAKDGIEKRIIDSIEGLRFELKKLRANLLAEGSSKAPRTSPNRVRLDSGNGSVDALQILKIKHDTATLCRENWLTFSEREPDEATTDMETSSLIDSFRVVPNRGKTQDGGIKISLFSKLENFLADLEREESLPELAKDRVVDRKIREIRKGLASDWILYLNADESKLVEIIWLLAETSYRVVRRAKMESLAVEWAKDQVQPDEEVPDELQKRQTVVNVLWRASCGLCGIGFHLSRSLSNVNYAADCRLRIQLLTLYAVSLGYLHRFKEVRRRFNEAHSLLVSALRSTDRKEEAKIQLRQAEVSVQCATTKYANLQRAARVFHDSKKKEEEERQKAHERFKREERRFFAHIDEAWNMIEAAEESLTGSSHSAFWWFRANLIKLSVYALLGRLSLRENEIRLRAPLSRIRLHENTVDIHHTLPYRRRLHPPTVIIDALRESLSMSQDDDFRKIRAIQYFLQAQGMFLDKNSRLIKFIGNQQDPEPDFNRFELIGEAFNCSVKDINLELSDFLDSAREWSDPIRKELRERLVETIQRIRFKFEETGDS
ncbi:MAG: SIR2 family protein [Verrucomicrobiota bacterium]